MMLPHKSMIKTLQHVDSVRPCVRSRYIGPEEKEELLFVGTEMTMIRWAMNMSLWENEDTLQLVGGEGTVDKLRGIRL